jgi:hypothetical protein
MSVDRLEYVANRIVASIQADFTDRRGLRQQWESIDDEIQNEIIDTWVALTKGVIVEEGLLDEQSE